MPGAVHQADAAPVQLQDAVHDAQAQAAIAARAADGEGPQEQTFTQLRGDARAAVADGDAHAIRFG